MNKSAFGAAFVAGALFFCGSVNVASAASPATNAFLANLTPNVDFLDQSSRTALTVSKSKAVRAYAHDEAANQTRAANALYDWTKAQDAREIAASSGYADAKDLKSGRSVAVDGTSQPQVALADDRTPLGDEDLTFLGGLEGKEFDDTYKLKQSEALRQVEYDYAQYLVKGDDPALKTMAQRELPKVRKRLELLGKL